METLTLINSAYDSIYTFTLIFVRVFSMLYTVSIFRRDMATIRVVSTLAFVLSLYPLILNKQPVVSTDINTLTYMFQSFLQIIIGFCTGIIINIMFEVFVAAGQIISLQIGLSIASLFDPRFGVVTTLTQFYLITGIVVFFGMNGHMMLISMIIKSFSFLPITLDISHIRTDVIIKYSGIIYYGAVSLSITIIAATLLTNICLAIISKFAPQFNLFSVGLNLTLLLGLGCIYITYQIFINKGEDYIRNGMEFYQSYLMELRRA